MKRLLLLTLLGVAAACSDQPLTTEPSATSALLPKTTLAAQAPDRQADLVADAVARIAPVFGESAGALARSALRALEARVAAGDAAGVGAAMPAIENALDRIERDEPGHAADVAAIRLAIAAL